MSDREITPAMTYGSYLKLPELLSLQEQASDPEEHDELLFIVIHQVYELWFKEILHELDEFVEHLDDDRQAQSGHQLRRVLRILKTLISQMDVLETMTPLEFKSFRSFLNNSSGFQSAQFREIEFLAPLTVSLLTQHRTTAPYGLNGANAGQPGKQTLLKSDGTTIELSPTTKFEAQPGDRLKIETPGGGAA